MDAERTRVPVWMTLFAAAVFFTVTVGAVLGAAGFRTSGFALTVVPGQVLPLLGAFAVMYAAVAALFLLLTTRRRRAGGVRASEGPVFHALATVTLWVALVLMFLPLKGSEAFVRADTLTTVQLNAIGLAVIVVSGWVAGWIVARLLSALLGALRRRLSGRSVRLLGVAYVTLALLILFVGVGARGRGDAGAAPADTPRVVIIGVDGCDWEKLGPLVEAGRLPNFESLMERGAYGPLRSAAPLVSPRIWTTIATGKTPEKHGILGFVNESGVPVNATMRTAAPVWDIASAAGLPVGVVGWYVTWPVDEVNGFLVSDRLHSLLRGPVQMLQSVTGRPTNDRLETFGQFEFDPSYKGYDESELRYQQNRIVDEPLRWGYLRDAIYSRVTRALAPSYHPTFAAVYLRGVDFVQHFFWQYSDPEPFESVTEADIAAYGPVIDNYYVYTDALLGELLDSCGEDVNVLIVSDHGFKARLDLDPGRPRLTGTHDYDGVLIAAGPEIARAGRIEGATIFDVTPTALAIMGLPVGEDMDGRVLSEVITEERLAERPVSYIPSYEPALGRERGEVGSTMDDSIKEQLRSLGYIE